MNTISKLDDGMLFMCDGYAPSRKKIVLQPHPGNKMLNEKGESLSLGEESMTGTTKRAKASCVTRRLKKYGRTGKCHQLDRTHLKHTDAIRNIKTDCSKALAKKMIRADKKFIAKVKRSKPNKEIIGINTGRVLYYGTQKQCNQWLRDNSSMKTLVEIR